jgi:hypothetical protein
MRAYWNMFRIGVLVSFACAIGCPAVYLEQSPSLLFCCSAFPAHLFWPLSSSPHFAFTHLCFDNDAGVAVVVGLVLKELHPHPHWFLLCLPR